MLSWESGAEYEGGPSPGMEEASTQKGTAAACIIVEVCMVQRHS